MLNIYKWKINHKLYLYSSSDELKQKLKVFRGSIWSVIFGFIICFIVLLSFNINPFAWLYDVFRFSFRSGTLNRALTWWALYTIAGISMAVAFKTGLFNIGAAGQMLTSASITILIGLKLNLNQAENLVLCITIGILAGALVAMFAGILKAYFNVHEVVTTILLNYIIWYVFKYIFTQMGQLNASGSTNNFNNLMSMKMGRYDFILPLIFATLIALGVIILFAKTTTGYKMKAVGLNKNASMYAGINIRYNTIFSLSLSGALAGLMGVFWILTPGVKHIPFAVTNLPSLGFDGIAIALIGANNPLGILITSFFWAIINIGAQVSIGVYPSLPSTIPNLIFGFIIYCAAISVLFQKLKVYSYIKEFFINIVNKNTNKTMLKLNWNIIKLSFVQLWFKFLLITQSFKVNTKYSLYYRMFKTKHQLTENFYKTKKEYQLKIKSANNSEIKEQLKVELDLIADKYLNDIDEEKAKLLQKYVEQYEKNLIQKKELKNQVKTIWISNVNEYNSKPSRATKHNYRREKFGIYAWALDQSINYDLEKSTKLEKETKNKNEIINEYIKKYEDLFKTEQEKLKQIESNKKVRREVK